MFKRFIIGLIILGALGAGWYLWRGKQAPAGDGMMAANMGAQAQPVSVLKVAPQDIQLKRVLPGRISAIQQAQVRPQVDGIITKRLFEEGATVEKGMQLYQIDDARYKATLASTQADLKSAEANIKSILAKANRYKELVKINAVSRQEYDDVVASLAQAKADVAVAQAQIDLAQVDVDYTQVYAPISGRIGRSYITEGALVTGSQSQHLAIITQLDPVYIDMTYSGEDTINLRTRMAEHKEIPVTLVDDGQGRGQNYTHQGVLKFSEVTVDETTGSVALRAEIPNPDGILLPGLFVRAELDMGLVKDVLLVPQRATSRRPDGGLDVWVVQEDNSVKQQKIAVSGTYQDNWIVENGLMPNDTIIVEGYQKVGPGSVVSPAPWQGGADADVAPLKEHQE